MNGVSVRTNTNTELLKIIACVTMVIDHVGAVFFRGSGEYMFLRYIGRIAFPLFAYCLAVGCRCTRHIGLYFLRMLALAVVVQPLYVTAMGHVSMGTFNWAQDFYRLDLVFDHYYGHGKLNILFSLSVGILLLWTVRGKKYFFTAPLTLAVYLLDGRLDYGYKGILMMVLFFVFADRPLTGLIWELLLMMQWGMPSLFTRLSFNHSTQIYALAALPLIYLPMHSRIRMPKFVFYAFYPAHLAVIYLIQYWGRYV